MSLIQPSRAYVEGANFTMGFPAGLRIEMQIRIEIVNGQEYQVPFAVVDPNWELNEGVLMYKKDSKYVPESDKYSVLKRIFNVYTKQAINTSQAENEQIKQRIFELCEGEMVYYRSLVEVHMFDCFSEDFDSLPEPIQEKVFSYFQ